MKKATITIALVLAVCFGVMFDVNAAVTTPVAGVAMATATADVIDTELPYAAKVVGVKVNPVAAGKYYRLRHTNASGAIIYETNSAATTGTMALDRVEFLKPSAGLYFQTDDSAANIIIYTEQ